MPNPQKKSPRQRFSLVMRLLALLAFTALFVNSGLHVLPTNPHQALFYFSLPTLLLLTFFLPTIVSWFLNPPQKTAVWIASTFFHVGLSFLIGFLLAAASLIAGIIYMVREHGIFAGLCLCLLGALMLILQLGRVLAFRRQTKTAITSTLRKHGFCTHCGYDLRESSTRCPECGNPVPPENRTRSVSEGVPHLPATENIEI